MPWIISQLLGALLMAATSLVGRVLIAIGFGFVEYVGLQAMVDATVAQVRGLFTGSNFGDFMAWVGFLRLDVHVTIIISAIGAKMLLNAMTGGSFKRMVMKG